MSEGDDCTGGFFPCSGTWTGNIMLVAAYGWILAFGARTMADGSELLLDVLHPGFIGGFIIPLLGALPDTTIIFVSICFGDPQTAREQITIGVGTLTGSTIMLLTIAWVAGLMAGRCDIVDNKSVDRTLTQKWSIMRTGISTEKDIRSNAIIMVATTLSYFVVQIPAFVDMAMNTPPEKREQKEQDYVLAAFVLTCVFFLAYSVYMVFDTTVQERRIKAARKRYVLEKLASLFVETVRNQEESFDQHSGNIREFLAQSSMNTPRPMPSEPGTPCLPCARGSQPGTPSLSLRTSGMGLDPAYGYSGAPEALTVSTSLPAAYRPANYSIQDGDDSEILVSEDQAVPPVPITRHLLRTSSISGDMLSAVKSWKDRAKAVVVAQRLLEEEQRRREEDGEGEDGEDSEKLSKGKLVFKAIVLLTFGTFIVIFFSDPMVGAIDDLSHNLNIPNFFVSFIVTPFASNASELVASIYFCSKKTSRNVSLAMAAVYGAVTMNSTLNLAVFLIMMWVRDIGYAFSSEVIPMLLVIFAVGLLATFKDTFTTLEGLFVLLLYPASAGLVAFLQSSVVGWDTTPPGPPAVVGGLFQNNTILG